LNTVSVARKPALTDHPELTSCCSWLRVSRPPQHRPR
jgi:hypothetical protein